MVHQTKKGVYISDKGMVFEILPVTKKELIQKMPDEELSYAGVRALQTQPDDNLYSAIAIPPHDPKFAEFVKPKAYIVGRQEDDIVTCVYVKAADYARGQKFGRILLAHDIWSAAHDVSVNSYNLNTKDKAIKEFFSQFGLNLNLVGRKKTVEEKVVMDFSDDDERERIKKTASSWLSNFKLR